MENFKLVYRKFNSFCSGEKF